MQIRKRAALLALVMGAALLSAVPAQSASAVTPPPCSGGSICFWSEDGFSGATWEWTAASGYRDMPPQFHDHVGSFVAGVNACFINWQPVQKRQVLNRDWRATYLEDFGGQIDGVGPGSC